METNPPTESTTENPIDLVLSKNIFQDDLIKKYEADNLKTFINSPIHTVDSDSINILLEEDPRLLTKEEQIKFVSSLREIYKQIVEEKFTKKRAKKPTKKSAKNIGVEIGKSLNLNLDLETTNESLADD